MIASLFDIIRIPVCSDCGKLIEDKGPRDGWQLEDGRTVCHKCCGGDTKKLVAKTIKKAKG